MPPAQKRGILKGVDPRSDGADRVMELVQALPRTYEDPAFIVGTSPFDATFFADQGWNSIQGWITCDGPGNILVRFSRDGIIFGDPWTMLPGENTNLKGFDIHTLRVTHVTDSAFRIFLI